MPVPEALQPYAGRWVALIQAEVAGVGATPEAARAAAQLARPKETPRLEFVPEPFALALPEIVRRLGQALPAPEQVWLVGGAVRDLLLGRRLHDLDFAVAGDGLAAARQAAKALDAAVFPLDAERGVGRVLLTTADGVLTLDFARLRGPDIFTDLASRDFTVNALALPLAAPDTLVDPLRGTADLRAKLIRACSATAITDDPVRAVRAVRLAAQLGFRLEPATRAAVKAAALAAVSAERLRDELVRCLGGGRVEPAVRALELTGLLSQMVPELSALKGLHQSPPHTLDGWEHTLAVLVRLAEILAVLGPVHDVDAASDLTLGLLTVRLGRYRAPLSAHLAAPFADDRPRRGLLMLAALLHDAAKPATRSQDPDGRIRFLGHEAAGARQAAAILQRLHFSVDEVRYVQTAVANHMRPRQLTQAGEPSARAIYRFYRDTGPAGVDIVLLSLADYLAKFGGTPPPQDEWAGHVAGCARLLEAYFERRAEQVLPPALITGDDLLQTLALTPGPLVGKLLEAVREAQAAGEVTDRAAALDYARRLRSSPDALDPPG
ncbi:MAG: HD domain-containing protein [Anaerolineales bacterium]|nr:HD domain-containing protein [Anaerolineales bacterium]